MADNQEQGSRMKRLQVYRAAMSGDWEMAKPHFRGLERRYLEPINKEGETALHIATAAEHTHFVKHLVNEISAQDLTIRDGDATAEGNTAFCYAAMSGNVNIAKIMAEKNENLVTVRGRRNVLPIYLAALRGHGKMVRYLYNKTKHQLLNDNSLIDLLITLINSHIYDVALELVTEKPQLATRKDSKQETALHALARNSHFPSTQSSLQFTCLNFCLCILGKQKHGLKLAEKLWEQVILELDDTRISQFMVGGLNNDQRLVFVAAEQGNVELLIVLIRLYPDLVLKIEEHNYTIFHIAVLRRHERIFKLIHEIGSMKNFINIYKDEDGNNMLHLAGMLPSKSRLNVVPGAALQLQRELLWFEEVKQVVGPEQIEAKNSPRREGTNEIREPETPRELFVREHKDLIEKGEKWMRNTASSCMVVATLIATVVFAAAFTVPGGNHQDNGLPMFLDMVLFKIYAISDALSFIFSASSVVAFLSILTSRYTLDDFVESLPRKLIFGLFSLFIAIVTMMVAFVLAFFFMFQKELLRFPISIAAIASIPIIFFIRQLLLVFEVIYSTYMSCLIFRCHKKVLFPQRSLSGKLKNAFCCSFSGCFCCLQQNN